ncbi:MAG: DUF4340 domain-containing protein [Elainella sp. Prado103]|jgi:hypothetical protein|nr:DUF4340 domain-containing protein [Elainella sp. Prado103]
MKVKPTTIGLLGAALLLGIVVAIVQQQPAPRSADGESSNTEEPQRFFEFEEADVQAFTLQTRLRTLKFERDAEGKWQMLEPEKTTASDPSVAFLLDLVSTGRTQRILQVPERDRTQFGLHQPLATIDLTLKDQQTHRLVIGEYDFNRSFLYAQADPPTEPPAPDAQMELLLVSPNFDNAVNRPLAEWKQAANGQKSDSPGSSASPSPDSPKTGETPIEGSPADSPADPNPSEENSED